MAGASGGTDGFAVYVSNAGTSEVVVLRMTSADVAPTVVQTVSVPGGGGGRGLSSPMAVSPDRRFLYVALRMPPLPIACFAISGDDGRLTPVGIARLPGSTPYVATDRTGRFLFSAANPGATVAVSAIGADGLVAERAHQVIHIGHKLHCIAVDAANAHVYVSSTDDGTIHQFRFDAAAGTLAPGDPPAVTLNNGGDPRHMVFSPDGRFLYVTTEAGGRVASFAVDAASGRLSERPDTAMMPDDFAGRPLTADIHLTPDGRFLYASERVLNTIVAYGVDREDGALTPIGSQPVDPRPRAFAIAPDGTFLLAAGLDTGRITTYAIDGETGRLTRGADFAVGDLPNWIEFVDLDA